MSNTVIDSKTQSNKFGFWPVTESVTTTLDLVEMSAGKFGVNYKAVYSGVKDGTVSGGPTSIPGNGSFVVNPSPKVTVIVTNYSDSGTYISMHIQITVDIPVLGTKTIFDATLGGAYGSSGWSGIVNHISEISQKKD